MIRPTKKCSVCFKERPIEEFSKTRIAKGKQYFRSQCKDCQKQYHVEWMARHPGYLALARERAKAKYVPVQTSQIKKDVNNFAGKSYALRSPERVLYTGRNIADFVRSHDHLFNSEDVIWKKRRSGSKQDEWCRATVGLNLIRAGRLGTWKGWTVAVTGNASGDPDMNHPGERVLIA